MLRFALGLMLAPLAPALIAVLVALILNPILAGDSEIRILLVMVIFSPFITVPAALIFGIPVFATFRRRGWVQLWQVAMAGALVAEFMAFAFSYFPLFASSEGPVEMFLFTTALFVPNGAVIASVFWLIALRDRKPNHTIEGDGPQAARPSL